MDERKSRYELFLEDEARKEQPTKRCSKCGETKVLGEFYKSKRHSFGVDYRCKECKLARERKYKSPIDRFWKLYRYRTQRVGECIEWHGACSGAGKSPVCGFRGKNQQVARVVFQLAIGELADDDVVLLKCNNPRCVRHSHLTRGTKEDQEAKMRNRALDAVGSRHGSAKLTENDIPEIMAFHKSGLSQQKIATHFHVAQTTIRWVVLGVTWKHVQR